jgi:hypothetical protein
VKLQFQANDPFIDFSTHWLSRQISDDSLIAAVIESISRSEKEEHVIVTADLGLKLKARSCQVKVVQLPDSYKLPDEPLGPERRLKEVERELALIRNSMPTLRLAFADGNTRLLASIDQPIRISEEDIGRALEEPGAKFPQESNHGILGNPLAAEAKGRSWLDQTYQFLVFPSALARIDPGLLAKN